jgi:DNA-directed RNA polymerase subunit N (RpoN/RPB10)
MPIPERCFTCGKPLADVKNYYLNEVQSRRFKQTKLNENYKRDDVYNVHANEIKKQIEGEVLDELGFIRICCRSCLMSFKDD